MRLIVYALIAAFVGFAVWTWSNQVSEVSRADDITPTVIDERCEDLWRSEIHECGDLPEGPRKGRCFDGANLRRTRCEAPARPKPKKRDPDEELIREILK